jgi:uncharacterized membrane protein
MPSASERLDMMDLEPWLHFGHVLGAIGWVGGALVLGILASRARSSGEPQAVREFVKTLEYLGARLFFPAFFATLIFGVWLVLIEAGGDFLQVWVALGLVLFALAFLIGGFYQGRMGRQLRRMDDAAIASAEARAIVGRWMAGQWIVVAILIVAVWDMVFKPGL